MKQGFSCPFFICIPALFGAADSIQNFPKRRISEKKVAGVGEGKVFDLKLLIFPLGSVPIFPGKMR